MKESRHTICTLRCVYQGPTAQKATFEVGVEDKVTKTTVYAINKAANHISLLAKTQSGLPNM